MNLYSEDYFANQYVYLNWCIAIVQLFST